jgi:hypothetical protein
MDIIIPGAESLAVVLETAVLVRDYDHSAGNREYSQTCIIRARYTATRRSSLVMFDPLRATFIIIA